MNNDFINALQNILLNSSNNEFNFLYDNMSSYQKEIFDNMKTDMEFLKNYTLSDLIFDFDSRFIESILSLELDLYLKECKKNNIENKRNGSTKNITITTSNKTLNFNRPRLRNEANFDSTLIPKRTRVLDDLTDNIILLYSKNNSVNDIKDILSSMFNINLSTGFISNITQSIQDQVLAWRNRDLNSCYFALNIDCMYITIRDNKNLLSHDIPVYIAVGTTLGGHKEIVGMYLGNEDSKKNIIDSLYETDISESKTFWLEVFNDLKDRGVKEILYIISDGVTGIKDAIKTEFPNAFYQRCVVHIVRNLKKYVNKKDSYIISDFKKIYTSNDKISANLYWNEFKEKYKENKSVMKHANKYIEEIMPLFDIPLNIRKYIYTNNIVESVNSKVQRGFYGRGALPNADSAINIIYVNLLELEKKWNKSKVSNWNNIFNEIQIVHKDILEKYM
ncbi:MAG: IS256 family transposase [Bacilli bacterium]